MNERIICKQGRFYRIDSEEDMEELFNRGDIVEKIELELWRDMMNGIGVDI